MIWTHDWLLIKIPYTKIGIYSSRLFALQVQNHGFGYCFIISGKSVYKFLTDAGELQIVCNLCLLMIEII